MNLPAQAHLRKDVSQDWGTGGGEVVQNGREEFVLCKLPQTFPNILDQET